MTNFIDEDDIERLTYRINHVSRGNYKSEDVEAALEIPVSASGIIKRIVRRHGQYLAYYPKGKSFAVYTRLHGSVRTKWVPVLDVNVTALIRSEMDRLNKELEIIRHADACGILENAANDHAKRIKDFRDTYSSDEAMNELLVLLSDAVDIKSYRKRLAE